MGYTKLQLDSMADQFGAQQPPTYRQFRSRHPDLFAVPSVDVMFDFLKRSLEAMLVRQDVGLGKGERGRLYAWYWGYWGRAAVDLLKLTGDSRFARLLREISLRLLEERDDSLTLVDDARSRIIASWGSRFKDSSRATEITTAGLITLPMCEYASFTGDREVAALAIETLEAFIPERRAAGPQGYYFVQATENVVEALNHASVYGAALAHASVLDTAPPSFVETALGIYSYFCKFVRTESPVGSGYDAAARMVSWPYAPSPDSPADLPSEAMWKASVTIELPVALNELGLLMDADEMVKDIGRVISANKLVRAGRIPQFIGGPKEIGLAAKFTGSSLPGGLASWLQVNDPALQETILGLMSANAAMFPGGWFGGSRQMLMALAHLAKQRRIAI